MPALSPTVPGEPAAGEPQSNQWPTPNGNRAAGTSVKPPLAGSGVALPESEVAALRREVLRDAEKASSERTMSATSFATTLTKGDLLVGD
jgi:hypothetical protein